MNNKTNPGLIEKVRLSIRKFLIKTARRLASEKPKGPVIRNARNLLVKEIRIPRALSAAVTVIIISLMFSMQFGFEYGSVIAVLLFVAGAAAFFVARTKDKEKDILADNDAVVLICLLFVISLFLLQTSNEFINAMVFPASAFAVMSAMLLSERIGIIYTIILGLFAAFIGNMRFDVSLVMFCGSFAGISGIGKVRKRADFAAVFIRVAAVNILVISIFFLLHVYEIHAFRENIIYVILNAVFALILTLVMMPFFETFFSRTTSIKLIELSDFNNPLLKKLMLEAPGTYHHSLMTASIAEQAAEAIGANPLLARVGSYFHDIGKLKGPEYFIENQSSGGVNPHDALTPAMSSLILVSHVKDGVALAKKYNIDKAILDNIEQHHGTTMMHFFYHKALESKKDSNIDNFRYPGPKPQTKEAAILMIADSAEAACRAIDDPTAVRIRETVEKIINNKFTDGQFSECPITLRDLQIIGDSVISSLIGIYHARIEYKDN